jgi:hypothetical protein
MAKELDVLMLVSDFGISERMVPPRGEKYNLSKLQNI